MPNAIELHHGGALDGLPKLDVSQFEAKKSSSESLGSDKGILQTLNESAVQVICTELKRQMGESVDPSQKESHGVQGLKDNQESLLQKAEQLMEKAAKNILGQDAERDRDQESTRGMKHDRS